MSILSVKELKKSYKKNMAVENVSFDVEAGDIYGILGPNGAGKSTTINMIVGFLSPDSGSISFEGGLPVKSWKKNIGYIPQELAIYDDLTAEENVSFFCSLYGYSGSELKDRTHSALKFTGLENTGKKKASEFSGGMKRRLNIAAAIAHTPKLIIMDEPTVGIDPQSRNHILESVKKLNQNGSTVLFTTHYMEEVEEICSKIIIIDHGKVVTNGSKDEVKSVLSTSRKITFTADGNIDAENICPAVLSIEGVKECEAEGSKLICTCSKDKNVIGDILGVFTRAGVYVIDINSESPSLEDVFLSVTGKELRD